MSDRVISIAIPSYNRNDLLFDAFASVIDNDNIGEVVIVDDVSRDYIYEQVKDRAAKNEKIKLFRNPVNIDCYFNKKRAVELCSNDWVILLDSDNKIDFDYLYRIFSNIHWEENTAYLPSRALPHFDYSRYEGVEITKQNVSKYIDDPTLQCCLNTANYFVNKKFYLKCWDGNVDPVTSDSLYMNYRYLENGGKLYIVPGLNYQHRVDNHGDEENGHYNTNVNRTPEGFHQSIIDRLKNMA